MSWRQAFYYVGCIVSVVNELARWLSMRDDGGERMAARGDPEPSTSSSHSVTQVRSRSRPSESDSGSDSHLLRTSGRIDLQQEAVVMGTLSSGGGLMDSVAGTHEGCSDLGSSPPLPYGLEVSGGFGDPQDQPDFSEQQLEEDHTSANARVLVPPDPRSWNAEHITKWLCWAECTLSITPPAHSSFPSCGSQLCSLTLEQLVGLSDPHTGSCLHAHLSCLLRRVGVPTATPAAAGAEQLQYVYDEPQQRVAKLKCVQLATTASSCLQLWQFLLQLLEQPAEHGQQLVWEETLGQFRLLEPDLVASMWGQRKSKSNMTYDKLSRALRYYYDKNILAKVQGKRYAYRFDFVALLRAVQQAAETSDGSSRHTSYGSPYMDTVRDTVHGSLP